MKILLGVINFRNLTGAELYVYELAKELVRQGHSVLIVARITGGDITEKALETGIEVKDFTECPSDWDPDILHLSELLPAAFLLSLYPHTPVVTTIHSQYPVEKPFISQRVAKYICIRPEVQKTVINYYGIPRERTIVIYNGVDFSRFNQNKIGHLPNNRKVLFVGTIDTLRQKAIEDLIKKSLKEHFDVCIVGEKHSNYLENYPSNVELHPSTWNVEKYLTDASETAGILLGRTTIEGWVAGRPGWIYDIDLRGNINSVKLHQPPKNIDQMFNIQNVAAIIIEQYKLAIKNYSYSRTIHIQELSQSVAIAMGLTSKQEYYIESFKNEFTKVGVEFIRQSKQLDSHTEQLEDLKTQINYTTSRLNNILNLLPVRIARRMKRYIKR